MGSEQKRKRSQAVTDSEGRVFAEGEMTLPARPADLLADLQATKKSETEYYGAWVWHCCKGPNPCGEYLHPNNPHFLPGECVSVKVMVKDIPEMDRAYLLGLVDLIQLFAEGYNP